MKILHLADTHYDLNTEHLHYPDSREMVVELFQWLKERKNDFDMVIISGDITVKGTTYIEELKYVKEKFDSLKLPYMIIPGNHDLCPMEKMEERYPDLEEYEYKKLEKTNFYQVFGEDGVRYNKVINNIQFIGFAIRDNDPDQILPWLKKAMDTPYDKLVFCHYPILPTRSEGYCSTWDYFRIEHTLKPLEDIIFNEKNKVLAYFCGHQHINSIIKKNQTFHIETASAVLGSTSYRTIIISESKINISTDFLQNNWIGKLQLEDKSLDNTHATPLLYQRGNDTDHSLIINRKNI